MKPTKEIMDGKIRIDSTPDADVYINRKKVGRTPLEITDVKPDNYLYSLELDGENVIYSNLNVYKGTITHIIHDFTLKTDNVQYIDIKKEEEEKEQKKREEHPEGEPEEQSEEPLPSFEESTIDTLSMISNTLNSINDNLNSINQNTQKVSPGRIGIYDRSTTITTSVPIPTSDTGRYQIENIHNNIMINAETIYVHNNGPGLLFAIISRDGTKYSSETLIMEGQHKQYNNVYSIGLRSPTAGLSYLVTERIIMGESAERFSGSRFGDRRNRKGVVLFEDDYESSTLKFSTSFTGAGTIARSTDTAYAGDFSLKFTTGAVLNDISTATYEHPDFHRAKLGVQIRFASTTSFTIGLGMHRVLNTVAFEGDVTLTGSATLNQLDVTLSPGNTRVIPLPIRVEGALTVWNTFKIVIDIVNNTYISVTVNGTTIDLSSIPLFQVASGFTNADFVLNLITLQCPFALGGCAAIAYVDNYIFTEDEP